MRKRATFFRLIALLLVSIMATEAYSYDPNRIKRPRPVGETDPLPDGWKFEDIGNITPPSDWCYDAEQAVFYLKSYGKEHFGTSDDQCGFFYFETDEDKQVSARIMDAETVDGAAGKGMLLVRAGLGGTDPWVFIEVKKQGGNTVCFDWRLTKGGSAGSSCEGSGTVGSTFNPPNCFPRWIRLVRQGLYMTAFHKDDVEGASWKAVGNGMVKKVEFKGKVFMGIAACAVENSSGTGNPAVIMFDNVEVAEIELPYYLKEPASVAAAFNESIRPGRYKDIDITQVFGHAIGEYFTIDCESVDPTIATAYFHETPIAENQQEQYGGEAFRKFVRVQGVREGVTSIRMRCVINGHEMVTDYAVNISDGRSKAKTANINPPYAWTLESLEIPINQDMVWGNEFNTKKLSLSKTFPVFVGAWEYDWGGQGVGHYSSTKFENPSSQSQAIDYVKGAKPYPFRNGVTNYSQYIPNSSSPKPGTKYTYTYGKDEAKKVIPYMTSWFSQYTLNTPDLREDTYISMAFVEASDSSSQLNKKVLNSKTTDSGGNVLWENCRGFWTEAIGANTDPSIVGKRGYAFLTRINAGDWVAYTVYAPRYGIYKFTPVAATKEQNQSVRIDVNGIMQAPEVSLPQCSSGSDWKEGQTVELELKEGANQIKVVFDKASGCNFLGFKFLYRIAIKAGYSGLIYDEEKYLQPETRVDTTAMEEAEVAYYKQMSALLEDTTAFEEYVKPLLPVDIDEATFITMRDSVMTKVNDSIATFPTQSFYDNEKVIAHFAEQLPDTLNAEEEKIEFIQANLTNEIDSITMISTLQSTMKHIDKTSFLYKKGFDVNKPIEVTMKIDSIANSGKGTFMGIMLRPIANGEISSSSSYASFVIGSYEGGRLSYRWAQDYNYKKFDNENIAQDVYIKIRLNDYAPGYLTAYYSYDNLYWWEYLTDPLRIDFLDEADDLAIGLSFTGGNFANDATLAFAKARDFKITEFESKEEMESVMSPEEMVGLPLTISPSDVKDGQSADITFNVLKPGLVSLRVFDSYGVLVETIKDYEYMPFSKDPITISHTFKNIQESGIYMLRIDAPENEQYVRFRYTK